MKKKKKIKKELDSCFICNEQFIFGSIKTCQECVDKLAEQRDIYFVKLNEIEEELERLKKVMFNKRNDFSRGVIDTCNKTLKLLNQSDEEILEKGNKIRKGGGVQGKKF